MSLRLSLTVLVPALVLAGCDSEQGAAVQQPQASEAATTPAIGEIDRAQAGRQFPEIAFSDPAGATVNSADLKGRPVLLNLWATWCAPCIIEMPMLDSLAGTMGEDLKVLTVSQDMTGARVVEPFFAERDFRHLEPWLDQDNRLSRELGGALLPVTILFDANGEEVFRVTGGYHWDSEEAIAAVQEGIAR